MPDYSRIQRSDVIALGFYSICAQSIFIREMLSLFSGTEFVLGVLIAGWLFWVGAGGILGGSLLAGILKRRFFNFQLLVIGAAAVLPLTALGIRLGRGVLAVLPGQMPPFIQSVLFCFLVMGPAAFSVGLIYNAASGWWKERAGSISEGVCWVYIYEAVGSMAGGLIFSLVLLRYFTQFQISTIAAFAVAMVIVHPVRSGKRVLVAILFLVAFGASVPTFVADLDRFSVERIYPGFQIRSFDSSRYGEIAAIEKGGAVSYFSGGSRLFTVPDIHSAEEVVHIPMLGHQNPVRVLLIGGGLSGEPREVSKYKTVETLDCVQLDDRIVDMAENLEGGEYPWVSSGLEDIEINMVVMDGRLYLKKTERQYDLIIVNAPDPLNLELNRYYTREFYSLARKKLLPGGIVALNHSSSENFISEAQSRVLKSIRLSLEEVFEEVTVIPGETVYFIAGEDAPDSGDLTENLARLGLENRFITRDYLSYRLSGERIEYTRSSIDMAEGAEENSDWIPVLTSYELLLELSRKGSHLAVKGVRVLLENRWLTVIILAIAISIAFFSSGHRKAAKLDVWSVGLGAFLYQINVLLSYQSFSGYLYSGIVIMTALFMAGVSIGTWSTARGGPRILRSPYLLHFLFAFFAVVIFLWMRMTAELDYEAASAGFFAASLIGGFITGAFYRVVVSSALERMDGAQPAVFYAWDMFGACIGGLIGGIIVYPLSGMAGMTVFIVFIHVLAAIILTSRWKKIFQV